jgi:Protein of unknown function (DUF3341)
MSAVLAGIMAEFATPEELLRAAKEAHAGGYRQMDAYSPFPIAGLADVLWQKRSTIPLLVLVGGIMGGIGGYFMEWYAMAIDYPINIGGRPLNSWLAFIPITFELTILCAALTAIVSMLILNRLPQLYHPVFNVPSFARASVDRFFLCIESNDPQFDRQNTNIFLRQFHPIDVTEVPA